MDIIKTILDFENETKPGERIGLKKGSREDLAFENITRLENAKTNQVPTRNASAFKALPGYDNITYTDFRNKETGEIIRKYNVRVRVQDKNVQKIGTTADKYKNIDTLEEALKLRDQFRLDNPKNIKPLDKEKQKITKDTRRTDIKTKGGVEDFLVAEEGSGIQKGHAQNIKNPNVKIKPSNIIYTPTAINEAMAGKGDAKSLDLDFKIREAEDKIKKIKNSRASAGAKKKLLAEQDNLLMKYVAQSDGFKTVTLSDGNVYGEIFQKGKSMDMFDVFPNMTEKEAKTFVRKYITEKGDLKPFYKRKVKEGTLSDIDKANIQKSKVFLENVELAKQNAKRIKNSQTVLKAKIPGLTDLFEMAKSIPDDVKKAKYLKAGFKTLGIAASPLVIYDTYKAFEQGKPILESLEQGLIGTDLIGGTKRILSLTPEERTARSVVKQDALKDLNLDMPMGFGFIEGPTPDTDMSLEDALAKATAGEERVKALEAQKNLERATNRSNFFGDLRDRIFGAPQSLSFADGGGVKSGPPPESGPLPQGLPGLLKRGMKI
tara:strand:- start:384 stop:2024 length:1641 start_codon:yes stop_codon:yes gene_type:complete